MKTLKKEIFDNLDAEVIKKLKKMDIYAAIKEMKENKYTNRDNLLFNDIEVLEKIDSMDISPEFKAALYVSYNPYLLTMEQWNEYITHFMDKNSNRPFYSLYKKNVKNVRVLNTINSIYYFNNDILSFLYKDTIFTKKNKLPEEAYRVNESHFDDYLLTQTYHFRRFIEYMLSFPNPKVELVNRLYLVDNFLTNADDNETYQEYYKKHPEITGVFKEDGTIDFSLFVKTPYIKKLVKIFVSGFYGTMGENIQKGVNKKLEELPKETYIKLIEQAGLKSGTLKNLNSILQNIQKPTKNRTFDKNAELISRVILEKMIANDNINVFEFYEFLNETSKLTYNESLYIDNISTKIVDIIIENKDKLSLSDAISLFCAIKYPKQWVRTGSYFDCLNFLLNSLEKDCRGTAVLISYVELFYEKEQPSMSEWKQIISDDLVNVVPHVALSIVAKSNKDYNYSGFSL